MKSSSDRGLTHSDGVQYLPRTACHPAAVLSRPPLPSPGSPCSLPRVAIPRDCRQRSSTMWSTRCRCSRYSARRSRRRPPTISTVGSAALPRMHWCALTRRRRSISPSTSTRCDARCCSRPAPSGSVNRRGCSARACPSTRSRWRRPAGMCSTSRWWWTRGRWRSCGRVTVFLYAKLRVVAIDTTARRIDFRILVDQNCGYHGLAPGIPTQ